MGWEITEAVFGAAVPLGILAYLLFSWSYKSGRLERASGPKAHKEELRALKKNKKAKTRNPVHNKWMKFGGGFYGAVGLYTFLVIEIREVIDFAQGYEGMDAMMATMGNTSFVDLAINFFINSFKNFIAAIAWPGYWPSEIDTNNIWLWGLIAYGGYWLGLQFARRQKQEEI